MHYWTNTTNYLAAMFVLLNPIGTIPIFLGVTSNLSTPRRNQTGRTAALTVFAVLTLSILAGEWALRAFGINVPCFQVGGGILVLLIALDMLQAKHSELKQTPEEARDAEINESVGVVPLGTPLMAGPAPSAWRSFSPTTPRPGSTSAS